MKRVLVTGGCGFIGRHVAHELIEHGYEVRLLDALLDQVHGSDAINIPPGAELIKGDVRDRDAITEAVSDADAVIHLAAEVGVGQSMYEIVRYVGSNDLGTATLLEELIKNPVERVVVASSMSIYGEGLYETPDGQRIDDARRRPLDVKTGQWDLLSPTGETLSPIPTDEAKRPDLASIYALTKYAQERAVLVFGQAYDTDAVALRLFNVFGAGQALANPYTGVLANFAARLANGKRPMVFEDGKQKRDFVHVRDVARAFRLALEQRQAAGHAINIGSGRSYTINEVARLLAEAMGIPKRPPEILGKARSGDIRNCFADIGKARELLGFEPNHMLENSLGEFAAWVRNSVAVDRGADMKRELEKRGLVS
ncbi:SDR family NAD(P)-dependent oxidoreductase [Mesorhizobium sp. WSM4884]|uniref:NAD-dependent epimerase/dehydratase family protein n=1 Tax=Mesorhizobium sp. WSM4884 TaxID=3038542 RepID=UPI0024159A76|nr:SDR family NAD(P)-dependent oxidoreductase [Mesorhizobium sp. WSM4884]MDG4882725.1 SDR family NAD(P)-dependent oxidoreductase [Mesorhizobium sp. WSM4884]